MGHVPTWAAQAGRAAGPRDAGADFLASSVRSLLECHGLLPRLRPLFPLFCEAVCAQLAGAAAVLQHVGGGREFAGSALAAHCRALSASVKTALAT